MLLAPRESREQIVLAIRKISKHAASLRARVSVEPLRVDC
jgi:hypothetical protein